MPIVGTGAGVVRLEDPRLLRGQATFIEDLELPRSLHVAFVRAEYPHARLRTIRVGDALAVDGVITAATAYDLGARPIPAVVPHPALRPCGQPILADGVVRYVGEPIAAVVAESRAATEDGVAAVSIEYEALQPVPNAEAAVEYSAPVLHRELGDNLAGSFEVRVGDPEAAFAAADRIVRGRFYVQRYTG